MGTVEGEEEVKGRLRSGAGKEQGGRTTTTVVFLQGEERETIQLDVLFSQNNIFTVVFPPEVQLFRSTDINA